MAHGLFSTAALIGAGRRRLDDRFDVAVECWLDSVPPRLLTEDELAVRVQDLSARVLVVEVEMVGEALLSRCDGLAVIGATRGDPWNLDVAAATRAGVLALRTPGRNAVSVAELAIGFMLCLSRHITEADDDVRAGRFTIDEQLPQQRFRGPALRGNTLGLVGYGAVGREVAKRALAFGMQVLAYDPYASDLASEGVQQCDLGDLLARSQYVSIHAALTEETKGLIGAAELATLPQGAYVVNTAREPIVDRAALVDALAAGHLGGAALDHFKGEFLDPSDPLCSLPNVVLTPHIGGSSYDADACHTTMLADAFDALAAGEVPVGVLNPEALERARKDLDL